MVVSISSRAAAGVYEDRTGPMLVEGLAALGLAVDGPDVVPDGPEVERALRAAVDAAYDLVVTTGGTGLSPTDGTPEATRAVVDREVPGVAEALRATGIAKGVPTAMLSRGVVGVAGRTLVVNVAGSPGACKDALPVLGSVVPHALDQLAGTDHRAGGGV
nr:MogA/MoaB family molybdenum cofactor biosynthesis protein [Motilibacter deserti]